MSTYIAVSRAEPCFLFAHANYHVVANLVFLQYPRGGAIEMQPIDSTAMLKGWTDLELRTLYKNTAGKDTTYKGEDLRAILIEMADYWPLFTGDMTQLEAQAEWLMDHCRKKNITFEKRERYVFVAGAKRPALLSDVKQPTPEFIELSESLVHDLVNATRIRTKAQAFHGMREDAQDGHGQPVKPWPQATPPAPVKAEPVSPPKLAASKAAKPTKAAASAVPATPKAPKAPRGDTCASVHRAAEDAWLKAGKPKDANAIKQLRKDVQAVLVSQGINKTTAGVQLLAWAKAKGF